jgi:hypothetical protein
MEKKQSAAALIGSLVALGVGIPDIKVSAKMNREIKRVIKNEPPRTMTDEEKAYYAIHKTLNGFK